MKAFTDYPIVELGDIPHKIVSIRKVRILSYDDNKYCVILVEGITVEIKSGYLYHEAGRAGRVPCFMHDELSELPITKYDENGEFTVRDIIALMNEDEVRDHARALQGAVDWLKEQRHKSYVALRKKYEAAEKNLKDNPEKCGGEDHIKGFMSGLISGMSILADHTSVCAGETSGN